MTQWIVASLGFVFFQYCIGHIFLSFIWQKNKKSALIYVPIAWIMGNAISIPLLYFLAFNNQLDILTPQLGVVLLIIASVGAFLSLIRYKIITISKTSIVLLGLLILFFLPLVKDALYSFLIEWDAVAMWFMKAKALFYESGIWGNMLFHNPAFLYTERSYPIGGPLVIATYYRMVGFTNDQTVQLYFLFFFLNSVVLAMGFLHEKIKNLSVLSKILITLSFFTTPLFVRFSHNGYLDMVMANIFISVMVLYIFLLEEHAKKDALYLIPILLIAGCGMLIKNEGLPFFILSALLSWGTVLLKHKHVSTVLYTSPILTYPLAAKFMWEYFKLQNTIHFQLTSFVPGADIRTRISMIIAHYLDTLQYTSTQGIVLILAFFILLLLTTVLLSKKQFVYVLPLALLFGQLGAYTYLYLITQLPLAVQLPSSFDRLVLQLLPALFVVLVYQSSKFIGEH